LYIDEKTVYQVGNKKKINYTEMHGQQNINKNPNLTPPYMYVFRIIIITNKDFLI